MQAEIVKAGGTEVMVEKSDGWKRVSLKEKPTPKISQEGSIALYPAREITQNSHYVSRSLTRSNCNIIGVMTLGTANFAVISM